ncbi:SRPBCC family protein [Lacinutrix venerupis]|uniref:START domain-containing protein n=1 Tax=Lacinutrix venerupis TaxID=1486034 RepID=A0AAC9LPE9_9FLAO|nr:hypothetical protein [Lacinutrix venerupis]APY00467.1 hypothetical protein BWR22_09085 [Lacinutrix venerupis]
MSLLKFTSVIFILLTSLLVNSQDRNWTIKESKDGKSKVKYDLVKEEQGTHFYYIAETTANVTLDELDTYFSNTSNHKFFLESTPETKEIEKISDNEWLAYYYFNAPWPLADSDIVIKFNRTKKENKLIFTANATQSDYNNADVERMTTYKVIYEFEKINNTTTKITYNADYIPVGNIPKFLIKTWFPKGPIKIVSKLGSRSQS